ncbi:MAG: VOC family protein [Saprospiraceae bacterium]|nr:VOC family protein [Saprospiraceae bacterium]
MPHLPYSCLWFDGRAQEAAAYYTALFQDARIVQSTPMVTSIELMGTPFMLLDGGPMYHPNPAISYFAYCGSEAEVTRLYEALSAEGSVLMPLGAYAWGPHYAWVQDRYGVNWQLDPDRLPIRQQIAPTLLFVNEKNTRVREALDHYQTVFPEFRLLVESPYAPEAGLPAGALLFAQCKLNGTVLNAMSSTMAHDYDFTPGNSLVISCDTQAEIDHYWERLGAGGHYSQCGWLQDQFGVSWQIVPTVLPQLMADPERGPRVVQAFLQMQKFDIAALERA